jgi:hypothetical protein
MNENTRLLDSNYDINKKSIVNTSPFNNNDNVQNINIKSELKKEYQYLQDSNKKDQDFAKSNGLGKVEKSIGYLGSFALIFNNTTGPAMMGLPQIFQDAGLIPTIVCIIVVCICSSIGTTLLADSIASIPGNKNFTRPINFSSAFRIIVGSQWFKVTETLFIMSCMVQACASLVETAQSLDGFIASFILHKSYALQIFPSFSFIEWDSSHCHLDSVNGAESELDDCTPFNNQGTLILSLGYLLTTLLFLPLGLGNLKDTILIQLLSLICFAILLSQFLGEFLERGLEYNNLQLLGNNPAQLAGVILFNFGYAITVPTWLTEKTKDVNVNRIVWGSSVAASVVYIVFGVAAAMSFSDVGANMLVLLSSGKCHLLTRIAAAVFGVTIIGCGVPIFCIIIKTSLYDSGTCNARGSYFIGAILPYLLSFLMYQGALLIAVLNWAGLIINGLVAFILPLYLTIKAIDRMNVESKITYHIDNKAENKVKGSVFYDSGVLLAGRNKSSDSRYIEDYNDNNSNSNNGFNDDIKIINNSKISPSIAGESVNSDCYSEGHDVFVLAESHMKTYGIGSTGRSTGFGSGIRRVFSFDHIDDSKPLSHTSLIGEVERPIPKIPSSSLTLEAGVNISQDLKQLERSEEKGVKKGLPLFRRMNRNPLQPLPECLEHYRYQIAQIVIFIFAFIIISTIFIDIYTGLSPNMEIEDHRN